MEIDRELLIARSLAVNPPNNPGRSEATGNLDSKTGGQTMTSWSLHETEGKTIIVVTHDLEYYKVCRKQDGEIEKIQKRKKNESEE